MPYGTEELKVNIIGDASNLKNALDKAGGQFDGFAVKVGKIGKTMAIVGGTVTAAFGAIVMKTAAIGDQFDKMSLRTGIAVEDLSALAYAADISGTSIETMEIGIKGLTKAMDDASKGMGEGLEAFEELGISVVDTEGNLRGTVDVLKEAALKISAIENPTKQAALAMDLFGARAGPKLLPLLKAGEGGIDDLMAKAKELGITMSTEAASAAAEFTDRMTDLKGSLAGAGRDIGMILIPPLTKLAEKAVEIIKNIKDWANAHKPLVEMIVNLAAKVGALAAVGGPILMAVSAFMKMKVALTFLSGPIGIIIGAATALYLAWTTNFLGIRDFTLAVVDKVKEALGWLWDKVKWVLEKLGLYHEKVKEVGEESKKSAAKVDVLTESMVDLGDGTETAKKALNEWGQEIETFDEWVDRLNKENIILNKTTGDLKDKILELTSPMEYQIQLLEEEAKALRKAGVEESLLTDWLEKAKNKLIEDSEATKTAITLKEKLAEVTKTLTDKLFEFTHTEEEVKLRDINREYDLLIENAKEVFTNYNELRAAIKAINEKRQEEIDALKKVADVSKDLTDKNKDLGKSYNNLATDIDIATVAAGSIYEQLMANGSIMDSLSRKMERLYKIAGSRAGIIAGSQAQNIAGANILIPSYQIGIPSVPETGLAMVHKGERITPAGQNGFSPTININNPVVRNDNDITNIRSMIENVLDNYGKQQFNRQGNELLLGV